MSLKTKKVVLPNTNEEFANLQGQTWVNILPESASTQINCPQYWPWILDSLVKIVVNGVTRWIPTYRK